MDQPPPPAAPPPPGWYPDATGTRRYWDGTAWHDGVPAAPKPPRRQGRTLAVIAAVLIGLWVFGHFVDRHKARDKEAASTTASASTSTSAIRPTVRQPVPEELQDAEYSARLIQRGVDFTPAQRDNLIMQAHTVCVFLGQPGPKPTMMDAGRGLMDAPYNHTATDAAAIATSAVEVYCPDRMP